MSELGITCEIKESIISYLLKKELLSKEEAEKCVELIRKGEKSNA